VAINITQGKLDVGTGCSGTDIWIAVLERLVSFWDLTFGLKFTIKHVLSCESVEYKQRFIAAHFTPTMIIGDLFDLVQQTVVDIEGKSQTISNLLMWCCGIECDSISQLSRKAAENRQCVAAGEGRTGSTARAHLAFLATHRPPFWEAENVTNLHTKDPETHLSNLDTLIMESNALGYYVHAVLMDASSFGLPLSRPRYYLLGVLVASGSFNQLHKDFIKPAWVDKFDDILGVMQIAPVPWSCVVLPNDDSCVLEANLPNQDDFQNKNEKTAKIATTDAPADSWEDEENGDIYEVDHLELFSGLNLEWPPVYDAQFKEKVSCLFSERKAQIVWLDEKKHGPANGLSCLKIRDVNLSVNWGSDREDLCPCIVSTSWLWARGPVHRQSGVQILDRLLSGEEALMLQGF